MDISESPTSFAQACTRELSELDLLVLQPRVCAVMRDSASPHELYRLADLCRENGRWDLWARAVDLALAMEHCSHQETYSRGEAKLLMGDWSGWADFESRLFNPVWIYGRSLLRWTHRAWDGSEDVATRTLLVRNDGGLGDSIAMLRFLPSLPAARTLVLNVRPELADLVRHNFGDMATVCVGESTQPAHFDRYLWSLSLPHLVGHLPPFTPLLAPEPAPRPAASPLRVGVCWACGTSARDYHERSMPLAALAPLLARPEIACYSLQVGARASDADRCRDLRQPDTPLASLADTANVMASLDLVVTVDTSVCHLAGSLGVPTIALLRYAAFWFWGGIHGDTTPWYPSMRLIRQPQPGDWPGAVEALMAILRNEYAIG